MAKYGEVFPWVGVEVELPPALTFPDLFGVDVPDAGEERDADRVKRVPAMLAKMTQDNQPNRKVQERGM